MAARPLPAAEEEARLLIANVADYAIFMLDPTGHITTWNRGAERIKGYRAEEIIGQHLSIFYTQEDKDCGHAEHELEIAAADGRYEEEGWRVRKDGSRFWANVVITAVRNDAGELRGFAKITRDFTERMRAAEELRAANEMLARVAAERTQFLAVTAHELRTPVTVVNGFATTLRDHWDHLDDGARREMVNALSRGGERLARLIDELLTASRLEAGALEVHPSSFDLADLVNELAGDVASTSDQPIAIDVPSCNVFADRGRVQQMLSNYLTNALRYGGAEVAVRAVTMPGAVEVWVDDRGPGVPEQLLPQLFGKFVRGSSEQGTGLGLFIVRELARAQGGDAWYEPRDGGGASFALRLPSPR